MSSAGGTTQRLRFNVRTQPTHLRRLKKAPRRSTTRQKPLKSSGNPPTRAIANTAKSIEIGGSLTQNEGSLGMTRSLTTIALEYNKLKILRIVKKQHTHDPTSTDRRSHLYPTQARLQRILRADQWQSRDVRLCDYLGDRVFFGTRLVILAGFNLARTSLKWEYDSKVRASPYARNFREFLRVKR